MADWPPCSVALELSIKMPAFSIHLRLEKQFSRNFYNLVLMLLVRVSVPFGEHQDSGCVYIGPTLKYSSPILSLDLSKNTGNGCCFPPRLDTRWTFIQTEAYKSVQYLWELRVKYQHHLCSGLGLVMILISLDVFVIFIVLNTIYSQRTSSLLSHQSQISYRTSYGLTFQMIILNEIRAI